MNIFTIFIIILSLTILLGSIYYYRESQKKCPPGYKKNVYDLCSKCEIGTYRPDYSKANYCLNCNSAFSKGATECNDCPKGTYYNSGTQKCQPCENVKGNIEFDIILSGTRFTITLNKGYYNLKDIENEIKKTFNGLTLSKTSDGKVQLRSNPSFPFQIDFDNSKDLARLLGFEKTNEPSAVIKGDYKVDIDIETPIEQKDGCKTKEKFFVSYAVNGPIVYPPYGLRSGIPKKCPIQGPVTEPSPLNSQYLSCSSGGCRNY